MHVFTSKFFHFICFSLRADYQSEIFLNCRHEFKMNVCTWITALWFFRFWSFHVSDPLTCTWVTSHWPMFWSFLLVRTHWLHFFNLMCYVCGYVLIHRGTATQKLKMNGYHGLLNIKSGSIKKDKHSWWNIGFIWSCIWYTFGPFICILSIGLINWL